MNCLKIKKNLYIRKKKKKKARTLLTVSSGIMTTVAKVRSETFREMAKL